MDGSLAAASACRGSDIKDPEIIVSALSAISTLVSYGSARRLAKHKPPEPINNVLSKPSPTP